jgi:uncharacterized membrane protein YdjX (TVP38/TMEM64 family)
MDKDRLKLLWRPLLLIIVIVTLFVLARAFELGEKFGELRIWIESLGVWGPIVFVFIYAAGVVAAFPGSAMTITAGALFGSVLGVIVVIFAATFGASLAFLISRYFARGSIAKWLQGKEKFRKLDELTEKHGAIIVALTRLAPIFPFNLLNYGFGLTKVKFWTYVIWSFICMLPGTILYVVGADVVFQAIQKGEAPWILIGTLILAIIFLVIIVKYARRRLKEKGVSE